MDELTPAQAQRLALNSIALARSAIAARAGKMYGDERDTWKILGYRRVLTFEDFLAMYQRQDVAGRIVDMPPQETWRDSPKLVSRIDGTEGDQPFFKDFKKFSERLNLWHWMEKVDRVSGIGKYGVLFIGVADSNGQDLSKPVSMDGTPSLDDIIYLSAYNQHQAKIIEWDTDHTSPRFGQPEKYRITLGNFITETTGRDGGSAVRGAQDAQKKEATVHWSRVLHVAEDALFDPIHGRPRLERMFNRLDDLLKISGGSSEMYWQNVAQIFHVNLDPELQYESADLERLDEKFMEMLHGIRRVVQTEGVEEIKTLQGGTPDPRGIFSVLKSLIASAAEIPQRILFGSEQGELASTQDQAEWYGRITSRRTRYATPQIILPFITRLASWGAVVTPKEGFDIEWPSLFQQSPLDKANRARNLAMAASKMDMANPDRIISPKEIRDAAGLPHEHPDPEAAQARQEEIDKRAADAAAAKAAAAPKDEPPKKVSE